MLRESLLVAVGFVLGSGLSLYGAHAYATWWLKHSGAERWLELIQEHFPDELARFIWETTDEPDDGCTCLELVHEFDEKGRVHTTHRPGCPRATDH